MDDKEKDNLNGSNLYFHLLKIPPRWHNIPLLRKLQHGGFISFIRYSLFWIGQLRVGSFFFLLRDNFISYLSFSSFDIYLSHSFPFFTL